MTIKEYGGKVSIAMTRGDSESITVRCSEPFADGDTVTFTMRPDIEGEIALQKEITDFPEGEAVIVFTPEDTAELDFGDYVYDIQLTRANDTVTTLVVPARFSLTEEVTR